MLDINEIREDPARVRRALRKRLDDVDFAELLQWDRQRRRLIAEVDGLKARRNEVSALIPKLKKAGQEAAAELAEMKETAARIKALDGERTVVEGCIRAFLEGLPNIPDEDVPPGGKENNQVVRVWGQKPALKEGAPDHVELARRLGLVDYERGVKLGGRGFWVYRGDGALLEWALLNFFVETHIAAGYEFVLPPHVLLPDCGYAAGQFPKFADEVFRLEGQDGRFLAPTAETALVNLHRDEVLAEAELPRRYFAYTPCYRPEAGSYRTRERGTVRGHQFNKVELFQFVRPEDGDAALEGMLAVGEKLVQALGLHYRVARLAAKDCSASMAKTFDIEVWIPSMETYMEVSSASNARAYQARRGQIRYKPAGGGRNAFVHTLNASGLATSRLLPALLEQGQRPDGSVAVPEVLRPWVKKEVLAVV